MYGDGLKYVSLKQLRPSFTFWIAHDFIKAVYMNATEISLDAELAVIVQGVWVRKLLFLF